MYAYGESVTQGALYVGSVADSIFVNPAGDVELKGLTSSLTFFKNTLAKLEVEPEIFYAGKFKSATEPFRADKMSDENRKQIAAIQSDVWAEMLTAVAGHAHSDTAAINALAQAGTIQFPQDAVDQKIVDGIRYWDEVEGMMKKKLGVKEDKEIAYADFDEYASKDAQVETGLNDMGMRIDEGDIVKLSKEDELLAHTPEDDRDDLDEEGYPLNDA